MVSLVRHELPKRIKRDKKLFLDCLKTKEALVSLFCSIRLNPYFFFDEIAIFFGSGNGASGTLTFRTPSSS